jgi:hypothetical protein
MWHGACNRKLRLLALRPLQVKRQCARQLMQSNAHFAVPGIRAAGRDS